MRRRVARARYRWVQSPTRTSHERCDYFRVLLGKFWQRSQPPMYTRLFVKRSNRGPRVLALGVFMEDEHVIRGPQTAGEAEGSLASVYMPLANYTSRRAAVRLSAALSRTNLPHPATLFHNRALHPSRARPRIWHRSRALVDRRGDARKHAKPWTPRPPTPTPAPSYGTAR